MTGSIDAVLPLGSDYLGSLDSMRFIISSDGKIDAVRFCDTDADDIFVDEPVRYHFVIDDASYIFDSVCDEGIPCRVITEDGLAEPRCIPENILRTLMDENITEAGDFTQIVSKDVLSKMLDSGIIDRERYGIMLKESEAFSERKEIVETTMSDATYPFLRSDSDIVEDHRLRLITDEEYSMFVWYRRNRSDCLPGNEKSFKLKFSTSGLHIMGRYDLCEYSMKKGAGEISKRLYCFTGTLFEGCGNVKAPDDAEYLPITEERSDLLFTYLSELKGMGILGGNYRSTPFSSTYYDLYTRYEDGPMLHTKGTPEYPYFLRMLMFIIGDRIPI